MSRKPDQQVSLMPMSYRRQSGFSLLEVLVAFAIAAMSIGALATLFSGSMRSASVTHHYSNALIIADSLVAAASLDPASATSDSGVLDDQYNWRVSVDEYLMPEGAVENILYRPYRIVVQVSWGENPDRQRSISLKTLALGARE